MSSKYTYFDDYADSLSDDAKSKLYELRDIVLEAHPQAEELFSYGVPAFTLVKGGKRDEQVMIAGFKNHVGLYPYPDTIVYFSDELKDYKTSTGTVQFSLDKPLPKDLIIRMVRYRKSMLE